MRWAGTVAQASAAMQKYESEKDIAKHVKQHFDAKYSPNWHVVVGKNFAHHGTYEAKTYMFFYISQIAVLVYKLG